MTVTLGVTKYAAHELAGAPVPNQPSCYDAS